MQAGIAREGRVTLASLMAAAVVASMLFVLAGPTANAGHEPPDATTPQSPESNDAPYWVGYLSSVRSIDDASCQKLDQSAGTAFVMPSAPAGQQWVLLVVKQSTSNFLYYDPVAGHSYPSIGQQGPGYSHIIMCSAPVVTTTTEATTTTIDIGATSTTVGATTSTVEATTTTTTQVETTTTLDDEVLNTTITAAPSTTVGDTSTSIEDEVLDEELLPFTGFAFEGLVIIASALALLGALLLSTRTRTED